MFYLKSSPVAGVCFGLSTRFPYYVAYQLNFADCHKYTTLGTPGAYRICPFSGSV